MSDLAPAPSPFRHILCGVDGSAPACRAAALAARLSASLQAPLAFLAVAREAEPCADILAYLEAEGLKGESLPLLSGEAEECLAEAVTIARRAGVEGVARLARTGAVASTIRATARERGADCIVLGRRGCGKTRALVTSSTVEAVGRSCEAILVLVR